MIMRFFSSGVSELHSAASMPNSKQRSTYVQMVVTGERTGLGTPSGLAAN